MTRHLVAFAALALTGASLAVAAGPETHPRGDRRAPSVEIVDSASAFSFDTPEEARMSVADNALAQAPEVGFDVAERALAAPACNTGSALFTWTIQDYCSDGYRLQVRFFDFTNHLVWPNASQVYVVNGSSNIKLTVKRGAKICYGAETYPSDGGYWGVSLDGDQSCASCCTVVPSTGNVNRTVKLTC